MHTYLFRFILLCGVTFIFCLNVSGADEQQKIKQAAKEAASLEREYQELCEKRDGRKIPDVEYVKGYPPYGFIGLEKILSENDSVRIGIIVNVKNPLNKDDKWVLKTAEDIELSLHEQLLSRFGNNPGLKILSSSELEELFGSVKPNPPHRISLSDRKNILAKEPDLFLLEARFVRDLYKYPVLKNSLSYRIYNLKTRYYVDEENFLSFHSRLKIVNMRASSGWYIIPEKEKRQQDKESYDTYMTMPESTSIVTPPRIKPRTYSGESPAEKIPETVSTEE